MDPGGGQQPTFVREVAPVLLRVVCPADVEEGWKLRGPVVLRAGIEDGSAGGGGAYWLAPEELTVDKEADGFVIVGGYDMVPFVPREILDDSDDPREFPSVSGQSWVHVLVEVIALLIVGLDRDFEVEEKPASILCVQPIPEAPSLLVVGTLFHRVREAMDLVRILDVHHNPSLDRHGKLRKLRIGQQSFNRSYHKSGIVDSIEVQAL
eukprot:748051-Hanusia_phi.AAC.2